jgi:hypothetical protein
MTKLSHRGFMHFAAVAAGPPTIASAAWAQTCNTAPRLALRVLRYPLDRRHPLCEQSSSL